MKTKEPTQGPDHICGTPDAMCDTDCMGAAGTWPMCDADTDRMERAAIAIENLTANLDALIEQVAELREAGQSAANRADDAERERDALTEANKKLVAALERGLEENALNCKFYPQADDDAVCCCGKARAHHWKFDARAALKGAA